MARTYQQAIAGLLPAEPVLVVGQPTAIDPSRAPAGKHVLWVQVRVLPAEIAGDAAGEIAPDHWDAGQGALRRPRHRHHRDAMRPGLRQKILGRSVFSPLDLERENPNLVGGDQICGSHHLSQNFLFRPARGFARWNTPVEKLHLVGAATWPGAGVGRRIGVLARPTAWREVANAWFKQNEELSRRAWPVRDDKQTTNEKGNGNDNQQTRTAGLRRLGARRRGGRPAAPRLGRRATS